MGLSAFIKGLYNAMVLSDNVRITGCSPAAGLVGTVVTAGKAAYGAWAVLNLISVVTNPMWICGVCADTPAEDADVATFDQGTVVQVGSGVAGSEVALFASKWGLHHIKLTAVGEWTQLIPTVYTPRPIRVLGAPAISARGATDDAAATRAISVSCIWGTVLGG